MRNSNESTKAEHCEVEGAMTKYKVTRYHGESEPCAVADPAGCFYSTGEVDRRIDALESVIDELTALVGLKQCRIMELLEVSHEE